jgi:signal transduction histidine kinase
VLNNVEKHAGARRVVVHLKQQRTYVELMIKDDGVGFDPESPRSRRKGEHGLGLLGMLERATYVGGELTVKSVRRTGTETKVHIPLPPSSATATA